jgi:hypothetical protein
MTGRPSDFTPEIANAICEELIEGKSLRTICAAEDKPSASTVCRWLSQHAEFREQYAHAREAQADTLTDEMLDIADNGTNDWMAKKDGDGFLIAQEYNGDAVQRSKLRIDTRKWYASKLAPKKYGDKVTNEHTGADGGPMVFSWQNEG